VIGDMNPKKGSEAKTGTFICIDAHTCGNPVRVVADGGPALVDVAVDAAGYGAQMRALRGETKQTIRA